MKKEVRELPKKLYVVIYCVAPAIPATEDAS